jgi:hypothetical protein
VTQTGQFGRSGMAGRRSPAEDDAGPGGRSCVGAARSGPATGGNGVTVEARIMVRRGDAGARALRLSGFSGRRPGGEG